MNVESAIKKFHFFSFAIRGQNFNENPRQMVISASVRVIMVKIRIPKTACGHASIGSSETTTLRIILESVLFWHYYGILYTNLNSILDAIITNRDIYHGDQII